MRKNMSLLGAKLTRFLRLVLFAAVFSGAHGGALALTCTPGVSISTSGFSLGCASPALWAVLAINQPASSGTTLAFTNGSGTNGGSAGEQIGIIGGTITTTATSQFSGNIAVTDGIYPSAQATNTSGVVLDANAKLKGSPAYKIVTDDERLQQARTDALNSVAAINTYVSNATNYAGAQHFNSGISSATTITATHSGLNLITIGTSGTNKDINLDTSSDILTFATGGYADVQFLVEVTGNLALNHGAQVVLSGTALAATDVLFNIEGLGTQSDGVLYLDNGSTLRGIVLDAGGTGYGDYILGGSVLYGELIGGRDITLDSSSSVQNKSAPYGCTVNDNGSLTCIIRTAPEPGTIALLALGLLGICGASMRKRGVRFVNALHA